MGRAREVVAQDAGRSPLCDDCGEVTPMKLLLAALTSLAVIIGMGIFMLLPTARLLQRVFALDMMHCPWCQRGTLRLIAVITQGEVIRKILRHLKRAADPPPITPARTRQAACDWVA